MRYDHVKVQVYECENAADLERYKKALQYSGAEVLSMQLCDKQRGEFVIQVPTGTYGDVRDRFERECGPGNIIIISHLGNFAKNDSPKTSASASTQAPASSRSKSELIRELARAGFAVKDIARQTGISYQMVYQVVKASRLKQRA